MNYFTLVGCAVFAPWWPSDAQLSQWLRDGTSRKFHKNRHRWIHPWFNIFHLSPRKSCTMMSLASECLYDIFEIEESVVVCCWLIGGNFWSRCRRTSIANTGIFEYWIDHLSGYLTSISDQNDSIPTKKSTKRHEWVFHSLVIKRTGTILSKCNRQLYDTVTYR